MTDTYIHRMTLLALQAFQMHQDIKELLTHYVDDAAAGQVPTSIGDGATLDGPSSHACCERQRKESTGHLPAVQSLLRKLADQCHEAVDLCEDKATKAELRSIADRIDDMRATMLGSQQ